MLELAFDGRRTPCRLGLFVAVVSDDVVDSIHRSSMYGRIV